MSTKTEKVKIQSTIIIELIVSILFQFMIYVGLINTLSLIYANVKKRVIKNGFRVFSNL